MREIVIVISDLYLAPGQTDLPPPGAGALGTLPGFEHAARFGQGRSIAGEGGWRPWLARWLGRDDLASVPPAVIAAAAVSDLGGASAWIATPVYLIAGLTSLHLDRRSILSLPAPDLESFAQDFNRTFAGSDLVLQPLPSGDFLLEGPGTLSGSTTEPARALAADLAASLPKGEDAKPLKRLGAELEMWLHAHPLNEVRRRRGELPVSTLWLWGGGPRVAALQTASTPSPNPRADLAFGTDPYLAGLWHLHGEHPGALPDQLNTLLGDPLVNAPHAQRAVLVAEVTPMLHSNPHWTLFEALAEFDRRLVTASLAALRQGTLESVTLIANDTELRLRRHDRLRFWRRHQSTLMGLQSSYRA